MQRISLEWFAEFGAALAQIADTSRIANMSVVELVVVRQPLSVLSSEATYPLDLKASRPLVNQLLNRINYVLNEQDTQQQANKLDTERWNIWSDVSKLQTIINGELAVQPVYHLWPIRAYDREILVGTGENIFSEDARREFNEEEIYNLR